MSWIKKTLTSSIGRKLLMALTGLFLILFLTVHLIGNLQLLANDNGESFNRYAYFMGHNKLIQFISIGNFLFIILHIITAFMLAGHNKAARPVEYAYKKTSGTSSWSSRNMLLLGTVVMIFLVVHLANFWAKSKFGGLQEVTYEGHGYHNLFTATQDAFHQWWLVALYVVAMLGLSYHLLHGFWSSFQTLGLNHKKYTPVIKFLGNAYAILVPLLFALIPVVMYFKVKK